jgi:hypothetical protein
MTMDCPSEPGATSEDPLKAEETQCDLTLPVDADFLTKTI